MTIGEAGSRLRDSTDLHVICALSRESLSGGLQQEEARVADARRPPRALGCGRSLASLSARGSSCGRRFGSSHRLELRRRHACGGAFGNDSATTCAAALSLLALRKVNGRGGPRTMTTTPERPFQPCRRMRSLIGLVVTCLLAALLVAGGVAGGALLVAANGNALPPLQRLQGSAPDLAAAVRQFSQPSVVLAADGSVLGRFQPQQLHAPLASDAIPEPVATAVVAVVDDLLAPPGCGRRSPHPRALEQHRRR